MQQYHCGMNAADTVAKVLNPSWHQQVAAQAMTTAQAHCEDVLEQEAGSLLYCFSTAAAAASAAASTACVGSCTVFLTF
jgi:predicted lipoprotein with Yx(FWY)xxD motif